MARIAVPTTLIHTYWAHDDGILMAAMDADRARLLIPNVKSLHVDSGHNFHWEKPSDFAELLLRTQQRGF